MEGNQHKAAVPQNLMFWREINIYFKFAIKKIKIKAAFYSSMLYQNGYISHKIISFNIFYSILCKQYNIGVATRSRTFYFHSVGLFVFSCAVHKVSLAICLIPCECNCQHDLIYLVSISMLIASLAINASTSFLKDIV